MNELSTTERRMSATQLQFNANSNNCRSTATSGMDIVIKKKSKLFKSKQIAEHIKFAVHLNRDLA
jgi:hypothetical protein